MMAGAKSTRLPAPLADFDLSSGVEYSSFEAPNAVLWIAETPVELKRLAGPAQPKFGVGAWNAGRLRGASS